MSTSCVPPAVAAADVCANCGQEGGGGGGVKLKNCTACLLVKYCGVDCQKAHRKQHKKVCKERAAELKDERLYSQGHERPEGEFCSICTLPIPLRTDAHSAYTICCLKRICHGCDVAAKKRGMNDCPFCRTTYPKNHADALAMIQTRVEKKDPTAIHFLGHKYFFGQLGLQKDVRRAVELWTEAAELGSVDAYYYLGVTHRRGDVVQEDKTKGLQYYKKAAMQGHVESRYQLGLIEKNKGNFDRAVRHFLISAKMGHNDSLGEMTKMLMRGTATGEQCAEAIRGYQDAVNEMESNDRSEAKAYLAS